MNDGHGQNRFTMLVQYTVAHPQGATIGFRARWAHLQHFCLCVELDRFIEDRLDAIAIWIYNEGGVVVLAVVWP